MQKTAYYSSFILFNGEEFHLKKLQYFQNGRHEKVGVI